MKTPRWYVWFTLGYALYNLFLISLHLLFPAFNDYSNNTVVYLSIILACVFLSISVLNFIMFIYFIFKKSDKHGLWLTGLQLFDVLFTTIGGAILQILLVNNTQLAFNSSYILGAIIPGVLLIYSGVLLMRK